MERPDRYKLTIVAIMAIFAALIGGCAWKAKDCPKDCPPDCKAKCPDKCCKDQCPKK